VWDPVLIEYRSNLAAEAILAAIEAVAPVPPESAIPEALRRRGVRRVVARVRGTSFRIHSPLTLLTAFSRYEVRGSVMDLPGGETLLRARVRLVRSILWTQLAFTVALVLTLRSDRIGVGVASVAAAIIWTIHRYRNSRITAGADQASDFLIDRLSTAFATAHDPSRRE
jgi:hypothetical protein